METQQIERTPAHSINWTHVAHFSPKNSARSNPGPMKPKNIFFHQKCLSLRSKVYILSTGILNNLLCMSDDYLFNLLFIVLTRDLLIIFYQ